MSIELCLSLSLLPSLPPSLYLPPSLPLSSSPSLPPDSSMLSKHLVSNLSTVAVVPISSDIPLSHITRHLTAAVSTIGNTCTCTYAPNTCTCTCITCPYMYMRILLHLVSAKRLTSHLIQEELGTSALERCVTM